MCNGCSHETLLRISPQGPRLSICYYHQDLHQRWLQAGSRPDPSALTAAPSYSLGLQWPCLLSRGRTHCIWCGTAVLLLFLISNFCCVLNDVCFLLGNSPASEFDVPTLRNTLSFPSSYLPAYEDGTDRVFRNVGI